MATIELKHIKKHYPKSNGLAVKDFNLTIQDREFIVLVGPSGCGKSTTLRMIAGLEEISEGDLIISDKRVNDVEPMDRDIAMVFQNYALYPHMTVYANMSFGLKMRKFKKDVIKERVTEAAKVLGLEDYLNRKPKALSGGQRQRVALGRAMVRNPTVFLMDEPLSNLDAKLRVQMRSEIKKLHRRLNVTTIYVTHDQTEAMTLADRIVIMNQGEIQQIGTPKEVYNNPANVFVGGFIGAPPMNFIPAVLSEDKIIIGPYKIILPKKMIDEIRKKNYFGKEIIAGIRPEDIHFANSADTLSKDNCFSGVIEVSELLGSESIIYVKINNANIIMKTAACDLNQGEKIKLTFNLDKLHFFDTETKQRII
jgi:multiple sugar transport system ATP-binding protein